MARLKFAIAVLLVLAALVAPAASYFRTAAAAVRLNQSWALQGISHRGRVVLSLHRFPLPRRVDATVRYTSLADSLLAQMWKLSGDAAGVGNARYVYGGFGVAKHGPATAANPQQFYALYLPWWLVALVMSIPSLRRLFLWRRRTLRRADQLCEACGYDVRHSPERCPECGVAVAVGQVT